MFRLHNLTRLVIFVWGLHEHLLSCYGFIPFCYCIKTLFILMILTHIGSAYCIMFFYGALRWLSFPIVCIHELLLYLWLLSKIFFTWPVQPSVLLDTFLHYVSSSCSAWMWLPSWMKVLDVCAFIEYILLIIYEIASHVASLFKYMMS